MPYSVKIDVLSLLGHHQIANSKSMTLSKCGHGRKKVSTSSSPETYCSASETGLAWSCNAISRCPFTQRSSILETNILNHRHLKPGGWVEFQCINGTLGCDDDTLPDDSSFKEYDRLLRAAAVAFGTPLEAPVEYAKWFEAAGFEGVTEKIFKMPTNPWPEDPRLRMVGAFEQENLTVNLEGISTRVFQKGLRWGAEESAVFFAGVKKDIRNRDYHPYYPFYVVYGQKPSVEAK